MTRFIPVVTLALVLGASGLGHGLWTQRWAAAEGPRAAAARLGSLPLTVGEWDGKELEVNPRERAASGATGFLRRHYVNRRTGEVAALLLLCGPPGPISVHTPEVCYPGVGYDRVGTFSQWSPPDVAGAEFWVCQFHKPGAVFPTRLRIYYSWSTGGDWQAATRPRWRFARSPVLFKVYVVRQLPQVDEPPEKDAARDFIHALLPDLRKVLTADS